MADFLRSFEALVDASFSVHSVQRLVPIQILPLILVHAVAPIIP